MIPRHVLLFFAVKNIKVPAAGINQYVGCVQWRQNVKKRKACALSMKFTVTIAVTVAVQFVYSLGYLSVN